jgi:hypothetical protein
MVAGSPGSRYKAGQISHDVPGVTFHIVADGLSLKSDQPTSSKETTNGYPTYILNHQTRRHKTELDRANRCAN